MEDRKKKKYMRDWSGLLPDLLALIAARLSMVEDFMAFRGVCTSWRAAASMNTFVPKVPVLMYSEKEDSNSDDYKFHSLYKNKICMKLCIPELKGKTWQSSSRGGWLITVGVGESGEMSLLNPFFRSQIELPNQKTFPEYEKYAAMAVYPQVYFLRRAVLSASPSDTQDFVLMVIHSNCEYMGFWRPGDESWTRIENSLLDDDSYSDVYYYNGKFYTITLDGDLWVLGPDFKMSHSPILSIDDGWSCDRYLLESSSGELLVVSRSGYTDVDINFLSIIQVDLMNSIWKEITSLGCNAIFVGHNIGFSVDTKSFPGIKPNCIYLTDDCLEGYVDDDDDDFDESQLSPGVIYFPCKDHTGIYHLDDEQVGKVGKVEKFDHLHRSTLRVAPVWLC